MPSTGVTPRILADSLKQLMAGNSFDKISVAEIVEYSGLNRNSFYYHFRDKYDLVNWVFQTEFLDRIKIGAEDSSWEFIEQICNYFYENRIFYINALSVKGQNSFSDYFSAKFYEMLAPRFAAMLGDRKNKDLYANLFADAFLAIILRWLKDGAKIAPDDFMQLLYETLTFAPPTKGNKNQAQASN